MQQIEHQPYFAGVLRVLASMADLGSPIPADDFEAVLRLSREDDSRDAFVEAERILARHTLATVTLDAFGFGQTRQGDVAPVLAEQGWRLFLVRVENPHHLEKRLLVSTSTIPGITSNMYPATVSVPFSLSQRAWLGDRENKAGLIEELWLKSELHDERPLSGFDVEYRILQLFSRDRGMREAYLALTLVDDAEAILEGRQGAAIDFECVPSREVTLSIRDHDGKGCVASLEWRDRHGRVFPPLAMRLAPDMRFQPQIYRGDGETIIIPDGEYDVSVWRGPEYLRTRYSVTISESTELLEFALERWIDPAEFGWYAADTHIHAAGCAHYEIPTEGVGPETMIRQVRGEALAVGNILTWGPGYYHQRQFFTGGAISPFAGLEEPQLQAANNARWTPAATDKDLESLIRYDLEVSGFPSSHSGHLVLLGLREQDYPGATSIEGWPSWNLPVLQWARDHGAFVGFAHCGVGMAVDSTDLPNLEIPRFNGIGTNEAIVDVTFGAVDFLSGCEALPAYELNAWYHLLNCGFSLHMVGETDYPCITDERPGLGRTYVGVERRPSGNEGFEEWLASLKAGRSYFGDGRSHLFDVHLDGERVTGRTVELSAPDTVTVSSVFAGRLESEVSAETEAVRRSPNFAKPVWHLERARLDDSCDVEVELVVNGLAVDRQRVVADGTAVAVSFDVAITQSSWVALRVLPSVHTQPVFVSVGGAPVRASEQSAQWCEASVDQLWKVKSGFLRVSDIGEAAAAYEHARQTYRTIAAEARALASDPIQP